MRLLTVSLTILAIFFAGCGGSKEVAKQNTTGLPDFMINPPSAPGKIYGSGMAKKANPQLAKEIADLNAKKEIAKVLGQKLSNLTKQFMGEAGVGEDAEVTELSQSITKAVTDQNLVGVTIEKRDFKDGAMYSLAVLDLQSEEVKNFLQNQVEKAFTSKQALLSEFKAKKGFDELNSELEKVSNE